MTARLASALCLAVSLVAPTFAAPAAEDVAALIAGKLACPARDAADGFILTTETDNNGKYASKTILIVDRKARRVLSRARLWNPAAPETFKLNAYALADGVGYGCSVTNGDACTLAALPASNPLNAQRDITSQYLTFRDFISPAHGGAYLALADKPSDVEGAAWALSVTPKGGLTLLMHAAVDGTMKAIDMQYPDNSFVRTSYVDRKLYEDCETAGTMRQTTHPKDTGYIQSSVVSIETRTTLTPADTPLDQPVTSP